MCHVPHTPDDRYLPLRQVAVSCDDLTDGLQLRCILALAAQCVTLVAEVASPSSDPNAVDVPSPLLGVFYRAPKPGEPPFIEVGARVEEDTVIAIIEVMKLMNSVRAGVKGEVVEVLADNGALVEYDQPLMRVRKA